MQVTSGSFIVQFYGYCNWFSRIFLPKMKGWGLFFLMARTAFCKNNPAKRLKNEPHRLKVTFVTVFVTKGVYFASGTRSFMVSCKFVVCRGFSGYLGAVF